MARTIDADNLAEGLKYHYQPTDQECDFDRQWAVGYNAGLNRALYSIAYARTIEPEQEWISVKDRLPDKDTLVLCVGAKGGMFLGYIRFLCGNDKTAWTRVPNARSGRYAAFWMPLPEPPEKNNEEEQA